MLLFAAN